MQVEVKMVFSVSMRPSVKHQLMLEIYVAEGLDLNSLF